MIIVNPSAGKGRSLVLWRGIEKKIKDLGIDYKYLITKNKGEVTYLAREIQKEGVKKIFIVGGDGTVNGVINGLYLKDVVLGIIPTGSGNDFAKMLGIKSIKDGLRSLSSSHKKAADIGNIGNQNFINNLGIGFDASVVRIQKEEKKFKNKFSYLATTLKTLFNFSAFEIEIDSEDFNFKGKVLSVSIGNGQFHGGLFRLTPEARIDDGLLDVCIIKETNKIKRFINIPRVIRGTHIFLKEVESFKTGRFFLRAPRPLSVHLDGELLNYPTKEIEVKVLNKELEFFLPR